MSSLHQWSLFGRGGSVGDLAMNPVTKPLRAFQEIGFFGDSNDINTLKVIMLNPQPAHTLNQARFRWPARLLEDTALLNSQFPLECGPIRRLNYDFLFTPNQGP